MFLPVCLGVLSKVFGGAAGPLQSLQLPWVQDFRFRVWRIRALGVGFMSYVWGSYLVLYHPYPRISIALSRSLEQNSLARSI
jgi:hypothetical protein